MAITITECVPITYDLEEIFQLPPPPPLPPTVNVQSLDVTEITWEDGEIAMQGAVAVPPAPRVDVQDYETLDISDYVPMVDGTLESVVFESARHTQPNPPAADIPAPAVVLPSETHVTCNNLILGPVVHGPGLVPGSTHVGSSSGAIVPYVGSSNETNVNVSVGESGVAGDVSDTVVPPGNTVISGKEIVPASGGATQACNKEGKGKGKKVTENPSTSKRKRAAAKHNEAERKRRQKINDKLKTLQILLNSDKSDIASLLDEVIAHFLATKLRSPVDIAPTPTAAGLQPPVIDPAANSAGVPAVIAPAPPPPDSVVPYYYHPFLYYYWRVPIPKQ